MERPKELDHGCPLCGCEDIPVLKKSKFSHLPQHGRYLISGYWWHYECSKCSESFTTAASDEISMQQSIKTPITKISPTGKDGA